MRAAISENTRSLGIRLWQFFGLLQARFLFMEEINGKKMVA